MTLTLPLPLPLTGIVPEGRYLTRSTEVKDDPLTCVVSGFPIGGCVSVHQIRAFVAGDRRARVRVRVRVRFMFRVCKLVVGVHRAVTQRARVIRVWARVRVMVRGDLQYMYCRSMVATSLLVQ